VRSKSYWRRLDEIREPIGAAEMPKQYGALPFRIRGEDIEVMLITSRDTGRWLVPKGWPMKRGPRYTAGREAFEESGVIGKVHRQALGAFTYIKSMRKRRVPVDLTLYPLAVKKEKRKYPECKQRARRWFTLNEAIQRCREPELRRLMRKLPAMVAR
jgi:8-oxo-dGTP pyrophosphatase MutT (NUDIX family)